MNNQNALYVIVVVFVFFPSCIRIKIDSEFTDINNEAQKITGSSVVLQEDCSRFLEQKEVQEQLHFGLTRQQAVGIALKNNPELQADFQNLGIAKADLAQAGLYTNPRIDSVFRVPTDGHGPGTTQLNIESTGAIHLSDLWKVPLKERVACDELEIISLRILSSILTIMEHAKMAYDTCLMAQEQIANTEHLLYVTQEWRDEMYYRQAYGYTQDLDKDLADKKLGEVTTQLIKNRVNLSNAFIALKKIMGLNPTSQPVKLTTSFFAEIQIPDLNVVEKYAVENRPEILAARMKVKKYKDEIALEKARRWDDVDLGISLKHDFDKPFRGWGPYFGLSLPIFDDNYAQIARACFLLKQAKMELRAEKLTILDEMREHYHLVIALKKEIEHYNSIIIPALDDGIDYGYTYASTMQLAMTIPLETKIKLYRAQERLISLVYEFLNQFAMLERAVGKTLGL